MRAQWHAFRLRLKAMFLGRRMEQDMAEELAFHQSMLHEKAMREGANPEEASAAARRAFGNPSRWHERLRELWQFQPLENLLRDFRFSLRMLVKSPGFTLVAVITLALGFGANMAIFSLMNALLLRPLPVPHSEQLVVVSLHDTWGTQYSLGVPVIRELEKQSDLFDGFAAFYTYDGFQIQGHAGLQKAVGQYVNGAYFSTLQAAPLMGRVLGPEDDRPGGSSTGWGVVISERFWKQWFGGSQQVLGSKLIVNRIPLTVVGVMPQRFFGADPGFRPAIYLPIASEPVLRTTRSWTSFGNHAYWLSMMGRLRPGIPMERVNAALAARTLPILHSAQLEADRLRDSEKHHDSFVAEPGAQGVTYLRMNFKKPLFAIFFICGGVLLLACLNLASLLLARSASRAQELATRLALGAGRTRLVRQLLIESAMVAVFGVVVGLAVAPLAVRTLVAILLGGANHQFVLDTSLDVRVWLFALLAAMLASIIIGLLPALRATSGRLQPGLRQGRMVQPGVRQRWTPRVLLALEVSLAIILLVSAGLLTTSVLRLYRTGTGFDTHGVCVVPLITEGMKWSDEQTASFHQQFGEAMVHQPGVQHVSFAFVMPMTGTSWTNRMKSTQRKDELVDMNYISPGYFETLHIPLLQGRDFLWTDTKASGGKVILSREAAKMFFGDAPAVGKTLTQSQEHDPPVSFEVVGVVGDTKYETVREKSSKIAYFAIPQSLRESTNYSAVIKVSGQIAPLATAARQIAHRLAPDVPAPQMMTMDSILANSISSERMMAMLSAYFAACALLVTAIGLYGTLSYETARRTSEIGIRMALGAQRAQVVRMVFQENAWVAVTGAAAGLVLALVGARLLASFLYETSGHDPWVIVISVCALVGVACGASLAPAVKAALVDPMEAIRHE